MVEFVDQIQRRRPSLKAAKPIEPVSLQTSLTTIYTAKDDADFRIEHMWVANVSGAPATYTLHFVPQSGAASTANMAASAVSLGVGDSVKIQSVTGHRIPNGATIQALCSVAAAINIGGWGFDVQADE